MPSQNQNPANHIPQQNPVPQQMRQQTILPEKNQPFYKQNKFKYGLGIFISLILISGLIFAFLNKPKKAVVPPTVTIKFIGRSVEESVMQELISEFESKNPYIKVKYEKQSDTEYKERLKTRLELGNPTALPDLMEIEESWITEFSKNLNRIQNTETNQKFSSSLIRNNTISGFQYGVPYKFDSLALAFNTSHLKEKGYTEADFTQQDWTSLLSRAKVLTQTKIKEEDGKRVSIDFIRSGIAIGSPDYVTNADKILQLLLLQNDATVYDAKQKVFSLDDKANEIVEFYGKTTREEIWDKSIGNDLEAFAKGKVSVVLVRSGDIDKIKKSNSKLEFKTVVPAKISTIKNLSLSTSLAVPKVSSKLSQSTKFISFLTDKETMHKLYESDKTNTFVPSTIESLTNISKDSPYSVFSDISPTAERFDVPNYDLVSEEMKKYLQVEFDEYYKTLKPDKAGTFILTPATLQSYLAKTIQVAK